MAALEPKRHQGGWAQRLRSSGTALAVAAAVVVPSGQARAVEQLARRNEAPGITLDTGAKAAGGRKKITGAFLGIRRRGAEGPIHIRGKVKPNEIDLDVLLKPKDARRFTEREFIFSDGITAKSELIEELDELDSMKDEKKTQRLVQTVTTVGGAMGLVYGSIKFLTGIERWMKQMELRDIEEERELTGQYISVDASDVDTAIDPETGKNLTISKAPKKVKSNDTSVSADSEAEAEQVPWLLRVLGLGGSVASDDDDFWAPPAATQSKPKEPKGGDEGGAGSSSDGAEGGDGGDGGDDGGDEDDDLGEDSSGVDALDDLLG